MKIKKRKLGSYPFLSVILSSTSSLIVLGVIALFLIIGFKYSQEVKRNLTLSVYLKKNITKNEVNILINELREEPFISKQNESPIIHESKESIALSFSKERQSDYKQVLSINPFRDALYIKINPDYINPGRLKRVKTELESHPMIFEAEFPETIVSVLSKNLKKLSIFLSALFFILLLIALLLINNAIKLALFSQRFIIRSMQLVGATKGFIITPFLKSATLYGFISSLIASSLIFTLNYYIGTYLPILESLTLSPYYMIGITIGLIIFGIVVAVFSSLFLVRRYLKMSLDELY